MAVTSRWRGGGGSGGGGGVDPEWCLRCANHLSVSIRVVWRRKNADLSWPRIESSYGIIKTPPAPSEETVSRADLWRRIKAGGSGNNEDLSRRVLATTRCLRADRRGLAGR